MEPRDDLSDVLYAKDRPIGTLTLNRPGDANILTPIMCHEIRDCINLVRRERHSQVLVITVAGNRFFFRRQGRRRSEPAPRI
jgi:naphthoate synthase